MTAPIPHAEFVQRLEVALGRCETREQFWRLMGQRVFPRLDNRKTPTNECLEIGRVCAEHRERVEAAAAKEMAA